MATTMGGVVLFNIPNCITSDPAFSAGSANLVGETKVEPNGQVAVRRCARRLAAGSEPNSPVMTRLQPIQSIPYHDPAISPRKSGEPQSPSLE
jgi:hypothetical protein